MRERELNWQPDQVVDLSVLGNGTCAGRARILEIAGKRARLASDVKVPTGAAVRVEWNGQLLLGEVLNGEAGGFWMEIHHMLLDTAGLTWQKQGWQR